MDPHERLRAGLQWYWHPHVLGISIPKTLVIWASPSHITLAICVRVRVTGDAHITRVVGMGMPISVWQRFRGECFRVYTVIATAAFPPSTVLYFLVYTLRREMFKLYGSSGRSQFNTKDLLANFSCRDPLSELCLLVLTESKDRDWEVSLEINFFRPFGPQLGLKIREGARLPWIRHTKMVYLVPTQYFLIQLINLFLK